MRAICAVLLLAAGAVQAATNGLQARDINGDGAVDAYYDPAQGVSFAADANLAGTQGYAGWPSMPGAVDWMSALSFVNSLDLFGVTGWRLPKVTAFACSDDGEGHIESCVAVASELSLLPSLVDFINVQMHNSGYWLETRVPDGWNQGHLTMFNPTNGRNGDTDEGGVPAYAWATHDGDVGTKSQPAGDPPPIPEPTSWALLLGGLAVMGTRWLKRTSASGSSARR